MAGLLANKDTLRNHALLCLQVRCPQGRPTNICPLVPVGKLRSSWREAMHNVCWDDKNDRHKLKQDKLRLGTSSSLPMRAVKQAAQSVFTVFIHISFKYLSE